MTALRHLRRLPWPAVVLVATIALPEPAHAVHVTTVARGLEVPWELAVLPDGDALVTERPGRVRLLSSAGRLRAWRGDFVLACLRGEQLRRLTLRAGRVIADRPLLIGRYGRLRTVVEAPTGGLYVLTSNRDGRGVPRAGDDRILRVHP